MELRPVKILYDNEWSALIDISTGEVLVEGKDLAPEDFLFALGYRFEIEEVNHYEDECLDEDLPKVKEAIERAVKEYLSIDSK